MRCSNCQKDYASNLDQCPHCHTDNTGASPYQKPSAVCKQCATPIQPGDRYCPSCGFDQSRKIIRQTRSDKPTRFIGPVVGLFAFFFLVALSLGVAYYFFAQAHSESAVRAESVRIIQRSSNETLAKLKENPELKLSDVQWQRLRALLERDDYREQIGQALSELRPTDMQIEPSGKFLGVIPSHQLGLVPINTRIRSDDQAYTLRLGEDEHCLAARSELELMLYPGIYTVSYQPETGEAMEETLELSQHAARVGATGVTLRAQKGALLPRIDSDWLSARIFIDGQDSKLSVRAVKDRPERLGLHVPGTLFQLRIESKPGEVLSEEVELTDQPLRFKLKNGLVLARSQASDGIFLNGEKLGTYADFATSDYIVGPIEVGQDIVRIQGEGAPSGQELSPLEQAIADSAGGKATTLEMSEELKRSLIEATKRFHLDQFRAWENRSMDEFSNIAADSPMAIHLQDSLDFFIRQKEKLDHVPFAMRFSNDSFKLYVQDGQAWAEFIESYFIKYTQTEFQNHSSWRRKLVYDSGQKKWYMFEAEELYDYVIPDDNTLVFIQ